MRRKLTRAFTGLLAGLEGATTVPRRNRVLVFEDPLQGRVVWHGCRTVGAGSLPVGGFRQALSLEVAAAGARGGEFRHYQVWLAAFEKC
jgi:hypothetical protein